MIRSLIKLGLFLVAGILIYNYFFGTPEEQEQSKTIFREVRDLGKASWDLLRAEKNKLDDGKYDGAVAKVGNLLDGLKGAVDKARDPAMRDRLAELNRQRQDLEDLQRKVEDEKLRLGSKGTSQEVQQARREEDRLKSDLRRLLNETEELMRDLEQQ
ncbi:MAG: hypothetical protein H6555_09160 [Lewinellaceae bacterium]|nr:hypothetical protein [Lewinellaceae bacterium]